MKMIGKIDKKDENGIMIYECGDKYNGEWKENLMDGNGIFTYISGSYYNGFLE